MATKTAEKPKRAVLPGQPRARRLTTGGRTVKMIRPVCTQCDTSFAEWWKECPHNPYVSVVPRKYEVPSYEDVLDEEGNPTGRKRITGTTEEVEYEARPNWKEVSVAPSLGGIKQVQKAAKRGCIFPWELRSPEYPDGIAETCQFLGCRQQKQPDGKPLIETDYGAFCRPIEAKLAKYEQNGTLDSGKRLEVGFNRQSVEKRNEQLRAQAV